MMDRRAFLATAGATVSVTGSATAATSYREEQPEDVHLVYDETALKELEPSLITRNLEIQPNRILGVIATTGNDNLNETGEEETNVACYWLEYPVQEGFTASDSHLGDHEPIYVEYTPSPSGPEIEQVMYTGYHWLTARNRAPPTSEDDSGAEHPTFEVAKKYHHYVTSSESGRLVSDTEGMTNLHDHLQQWLDNGWPVHVPAVVNPWIMRWRGSWWENGRFGIRIMEIFYRSLLKSGLRGGEETDL